MPKSLTKVASLVLSLQSLVTFVLVAARRSPIPPRPGANEVLLYFLLPILRSGWGRDLES